MSKKLTGLILIAGTATLFVFAASPGVTPTANAQQILPGGRPAKIRSYFKEIGNNPGVVIPALTEVHGFIITDIVIDDYAGSESPRLRLMQGAALLLSVREDNDKNGLHLRFESGIPVAPNEDVTGTISNAGGAWLTISGYTY